MGYLNMALQWMKTSNRKQAVLFSTGGQEYIALLVWVLVLKIHASHMPSVSAEGYKG